MQKSKKEIIKDLKINSKDVGSSEVQIALLTNKKTTEKEIDTRTNRIVIISVAETVGSK